MTPREPTREHTRPTWFEDFRVGDVSEFGDHLVTEDAVLDFARRWDPQPFHVDRDAAAASPYGGLIASGWHTGAAMMRMLVDEYFPQGGSLGSPGIDELRWLRPVRPGDRLRLRVTVLEARRSNSRPEMGLVRSLTEVLTGDGVPEMTMRSLVMYRTRPG